MSAIHLILKEKLSFYIRRSDFNFRNLSSRLCMHRVKWRYLMKLWTLYTHAQTYTIVWKYILFIEINDQVRCHWLLVAWSTHTHTRENEWNIHCKRVCFCIVDAFKIYLYLMNWFSVDHHLYFINAFIKT